GVRYSHDSKNATYVNYGTSGDYNPAQAGLRADGSVLPAHYSGNNASPEVTVTWKPDTNQTIYGAFKTGYKAGGLSNGALLNASTTSSDLVFGPEKTKGFEVGYKADLLANTWRFNVVGYRYNYNGLQVTALTPPTYTPTVRNAASARTYG